MLLKYGWSPSVASESADTWPVKETVPKDQVDVMDIQESLNGSGDAYARLIERHQNNMAARMWRFTRDQSEHQELVQEVFVQAYISLASYRGDAPFAHWLTRIATNVGYKYWKKRSLERSRRMVPVEDLDKILSVEPEDLSPTEAAETLHRLLEQLPPRDRLVLMLRYIEERSIEETAQLTGWTQSMVKVQAWRGRKKLKKLVEQAGLEVER